MKQTFRALWLTGVALVFSTLMSMSEKPQEDFRRKFEDIWVFEKAEYLERKSLNAPLLVKQEVKKVDDLYAFSDCYQAAVVRVDVLNQDIAVFTCLFTPYVGDYRFPNDLPASYGKQVLLFFGNPEKMGEETPVEGMKYDAPEFMYQFEFVDVDTIAIMIENACWENGATKHGAVKCFLKRESSKNARHEKNK
jgi:hypothetical protein